MTVLYIARTFGPVGGMERYAFEVAREMGRRGHQVSALCRSVDEMSIVDCGVEVIKLNPKPAKRGWHGRYVFRDAVNQFLADPAARGRFDIIHSHENTVGQHVSTEHGPCTAYGLRRKPWKYLDYSARKNLAMENEKFRTPSLCALVSCSRRVQDIVVSEYPFLAGKITRVITPAYTYLQPVPKDPARKPRVLGFMGRDWKRKGLPKALEIFRHLRRQDSSWTMLIAGFPAGSLPDKLVRRLSEGGELLGPTDPQEFFRRIDILVHPATDEPFGMVVSEALTCGVPVVLSDQCGATDHIECDGVRILPIDAHVCDWTRACCELAGLSFHPLTRRGWSDLGAEHGELYESILSRFP